ncbi:phage head spike fiber domain-containing protein [Cytobacillus sp. IB215665]|uniref:phage head spike fiber domain-containing protein n=1 Tax=Cytobacillus sp. IB215665 TaxID=3097357 RepID=UPI002A17D660|nr:hypothetical protein [Cytobacillus sp. IB215665]MDX8365360.1 hypothetical protein [Cytobacillus sp. IB215665]
MNKFGKFLSTTALAASLVTSSFLPATSFAAEGDTTTNQTENIFVTPLTQSGSNIISKSASSPAQPLAPVPDLVEIFEGYDAITYGLPKDTRELQGGVTTLSGSVLNFIPLDIYLGDYAYIFGTFIMPTSNFFNKINPNFDGDIFLGYIDNDGEYHSYYNGILNEPPNEQGKHGTLMLNPDLLPANDDSSIILDAYYERVYDSQIDFSGGTKTIVDTKSSGITKSKSFDLSRTIGSTVSFEAGLDKIAKISASLSSSLTTSFGHSISIQENHDVQLRHTFGERYDDPYAYNVYHLVGEYRFYPSDLVKDLVGELYVMGINPSKETLQNYSLGEVEVGNTTFTYPTDDYRAIEIYQNGLRIPEQNLLDQYSINDFTHSSWSNTDVSVSYGSVTAPDSTLAQKLTPASVNKGVQQYVDINSDGNKYTFGVWLKADEPHDAQIKIQNHNNTESTGIKVEVTTDWQYFSVTSDKPFTTNGGVTVVLWPGAYNGTTDSVYAWGAELIKE